MFNILLALGLLCAQTPDTLSVAKITSDRNRDVVSSAPLLSREAEEISRLGAKSLGEALRTVGGVTVKDYGGIGGLKTVSIRGFGATHTAVSLDGISVSNTQTGQIDLSHIDIDNLQSISVGIGLGDELFKSARELSSVGLVSLQSKEPLFYDKNTNISLSASAGSFGTYTQLLHLEQKLSKTSSLRSSFKHLTSKGDYPFIVHNGNTSYNQSRLGSEVENTGGELLLFNEMGKYGRMRSRISVYSSDRALPGAVILYTQDPHEYLKDLDINASSVYSWNKGGAAKFEIKGSYSAQKTRYTNTSALYQEPEIDDYLQQEWYLSGVGKYSFTESLSLFISQDLALGTLKTSVPPCSDPTRISAISAVSLQYHSNTLTANASLLGDYITETVTNGTASKDRKSLNPSLSASYKVCDEIRLRSSWKMTHRNPTFNDLYYSNIGNTALKSESAKQFDLGITFSKNYKKLYLASSLDFYHNNVDNKIVATPTMFVWRMRNIDKVVMNGVDYSLETAAPLGEKIKLHTRLSYSFLSALNMTNPESKSYRNQICYTPKHSGNASIIASSPWIDLGASIVAVGERFTLDQNTSSNRIAPYADLGLSASRSFKTRIGTIDINAQALNITNYNYEIIKNYPMPGRNYRITIKYTY